MEGAQQFTLQPVRPKRSFYDVLPVRIQVIPVPEQYLGYHCNAYKLFYDPSEWGEDLKGYLVSVKMLFFDYRDGSDKLECVVLFPYATALGEGEEEVSILVDGASRLCIDLRLNEKQVEIASEVLDTLVKRLRG